jgi:hypothetical protein
MFTLFKTRTTAHRRGSDDLCFIVTGSAACQAVAIVQRVALAINELGISVSSWCCCITRATLGLTGLRD